MDTRIQLAVDGELPRGELNKAEAAAVAEAEVLIDSVVRAVPNPPLPDLGPGVLERIAALDSVRERTSAKPWEPRKSLVSWLITAKPMTVRWRPAYAVGLAAAVAILVMVRLDGPKSVLPSEIPPSQQVLVQFRLDAPQAQHVALAGDFTDWKPAFTLRRAEPGVWTVVVPLNPGVHDYAFVVDGQRWIADPMAPAIADGFGGLNSRLAVLAPEQGRGI